jgi:FtsP/CotA-like multicopper oxidase with cupredoxin domain
MREMSRRQALQLGLATGAAGLLPAALTGCTPAAARPGGHHGSDGFRQPAVRRSRRRVLDVTLTAVPGVVDIGAARPVTTHTYDGGLPGATWEIDPGDTLRIDLVNDLPPLPPDGHEGHEGHTTDLDRPHEWTSTNLHTHGMHVSPAGDGDNVFVTVEPGGRHHYEIEVPRDHPGGIFWYHPHRHGGVTQQVRGGMAGLIVVRGEIDRVREVRAAAERVMVIQALELDDDFAVASPIPDPSASQAFFPRTQILYPINGVVNPTIRMHPGEVQRWRLLNAAEGKFLGLQLDGHDLHVLAWDGLTLAAPEAVPNAFLSAGNRLEVLVRAGAPGTYQLMASPRSSQHPTTPGLPSPVPAELVTRSIATVVVEGRGPEMDLPAALPRWDPPILPIARRRVLTYSVQRGPGEEFLDFGVDGSSFDPARPPYQVRLGTAEEWTVVNGVDQRYQEHAHGFHIHVNPFKVTRINGQVLEKPLWRDTFELTGRSGDSFTFESNFVDFTGRYVDHCHVLSHEDLGMMEIVEVIP